MATLNELLASSTRTVLAAATWLALGAPHVLGQGAPQAEGEPAPPNVLFIAIDDLNDWVGVLGGHPQARTPNIDRLAARGMLFTNAHCPAPICFPSRTALLTGVLPHRSGLTQNGGNLRKRLPDAVTLPEAFRLHGYRSIGTGKVFHTPDPVSWTEYFPSPEQQRPPDPQLTEFVKTEVGEMYRAGLWWSPMKEPESTMSDARVVAWATMQLRRESSGPFFLAVGLYRPHLPWAVPEVYFEPFSDAQPPVVSPHNGEDIPGGRRHLHEAIVANGLWGQAVQAYLASIAFMDAQVGHLLDALDAGPHADDTIVVLWSDHGFNLGEKMHWKKMALWEDTTHVPLVVVAPGVEPGSRCDRAVGLIDLYPTLIELCGLEAREGLDGHSLVPMLRDPQARRPAPVLITLGRAHAIRSDDWRYIRNGDGSEELYDHRVDPNEWTNLADVEEHAQIKAELARWMPPAPDDGAPSGPRPRPRGKKK